MPNLFHPDLIKKQWPIGAKVIFRPNGYSGNLHGEIVDHMYVNVLIIDDGTRRWSASVLRCELI